LLKKYQYGEIINGIDLRFFLSLFEKHANSAEKIGAGIDQLQVRKNQKGGHNKVIFIIRADASEIDISWRKCIETPSHLSRVKDAARDLVRSQVDEFRDRCFADNETIPCEITKQEIDRGLCHIDHCNPQTFNRMFEDWLSKENLDIQQIKIEDVSGTLDKTFTDRITRDSWISFHKEHASLRAIHKTLNLSLGSGPVKNSDIYLEAVNEDEAYENYREQDWP